MNGALESGFGFALRRCSSRIIPNPAAKAAATFLKLSDHFLVGEGTSAISVPSVWGANASSTRASHGQGPFVVCHADSKAFAVRSLASRQGTIASSDESFAPEDDSVATLAVSVVRGDESVPSEMETVASQLNSVATRIDSVASERESFAPFSDSYASISDSVATFSDSLASETEKVVTESGSGVTEAGRWVGKSNSGALEPTLVGLPPSL